jgi:hypothetical protein
MIVRRAVRGYLLAVNAEQAERVAGWLATMSPEQWRQAVDALRSLPRLDSDPDDADDTWRHLVPEWVGVADSR